MEKIQFAILLDKIRNMSKEDVNALNNYREKCCPDIDMSICILRWENMTNTQKSEYKYKNES